MDDGMNEVVEKLKRRLQPVTDSELRISYLRDGRRQFGHGGTHRGNGTEGCPRELHHHCDAFCVEPTEEELTAAGIVPATFRSQSRR